MYDFCNYPDRMPNINFFVVIILIFESFEVFAAVWLRIPL